MSTDTLVPQAEKNLLYRIKCILLIVVMLSVVCVILFISFGGFLQNWQLLNESAIAVALSAWVVPAVIAIPAMLLLTWAIVLRLVDLDTGKHFDRTVHAAIVLGVFAIVVRLPMGFILDGYLSSKNYSYCYWYTPPANFSSPVWVSKPQFCIEQTGHIRKMLVEWLQAQPNAGHDLSLLDVQQKVAELNAAHKAGEFVY